MQVPRKLAIPDEQAIRWLRADSTRAAQTETMQLPETLNPKPSALILHLEERTSSRICERPESQVGRPLLPRRGLARPGIL